MALYGNYLFTVCLQKPPEQRTQKDLDIIYSYLHGMEALSLLREPALRSLCRTVRYEYHDANDILYCQGELSICWYILLSGSVFIEGSMFLPRSSFGKRTPGCTRRTSECLTLEPSEMIVIDYPDVHLLKGGPRHLCSNMSVDRVLPKDHEDMKICRMHSETCTEQLPPDLAHVQTMFSRTDHCLREQYLKRNSRASDTSSAYSGSDMMQSSIDDQENVDMDLSGLTESMVDSEEEEGYAEPPESYHTQDLVNECLEKPADQRNSNDIDTLLDFMRHFSAFANMTLATRQALCAVMVFAPIKEAGTIVMKDGEELDSWSIILNGEVEITWPDGQKKILGMGNSFGVAPVLEKQYHSGEMKTRVEDCQFVCVTQSDYYRILHQGEENTRKHEEKGHVVMVTEHRVLDGGSRKGHIVIRGTPERLMQHLIEEEHSTVDPTYVEDFLLTYRTFLTSPTYLASRLLSWFNSHDMGVSNMKMKVARVVLLWVNNHFNDFETDGVMCEFLEQFEHLLEQEKLGGQLRLLYLACSSKAHPRTITLTRATREELLHFCVIGGVEKGTGIFVSKVEKCSKAYDAGLKRGDQVLEVNGINFEGVSHSRALEVLRGTTHLSITVKSNLSDFKQLLCTPERTSRCTSKDDSMKLYTDHKQRLSAPDLELSIPSVIKDKKHDKKEKEKGFMTFTNKPKIRKALKKINFIPKSLNNIDSNMNHSDESLYTKPSRKSSTSSSTSSSTTGMSSHLSLSNPDLLSVGLIDESKQECPEYVLKVYRSDQTYKFLPIHKETQAREVVMLALQEFAITDPSSNYSLCEVTVNAESLTKQKRLPEHLNNLSDRLNLNGRYYLKNNMSTDTLVPEEIMNELIKESQTSLLQLNTMELASQLTLADFEVFREIEPTEYIDKLFSIKSKFGCANIEKFSQLVNREMFWVVTEVCREPNVVKRMKTIKHFIKIAKHCKECKNFNSMFAIISGLGHGSVSRLRNTWDRLPNKYLKMFQDLQDLMNPLRNMAKYRSLISPENTQPPMLPFFPVIIKDLTFIHEGNDSLVDSLINFEKLRMIAREIRHICDMRSARYDVSSMYLNPHSVYGSSTISSVATLKRTKNRRGSAIPNSKKMFEESQMIKRVKSYLRQMPITTEEDKLQEMSLQCEPPARRRDTSPALNISGQIGTNTTADDKRPIISGPKFGSESPEAVQKLLALTDKVRPHNCKHPLPSVSSPVSTRHPTSPWQTRSIPVLLSHESSSVVSMSNLARHPSRTGSIGSSESASPTSSLSSSYQHPYETDSGHNSIASSNFDSRSTSSVGSSNSPPAPRWSGHLPQTVAINCLPLQSSTPTRPPLPPYHVVVQNAPAYSHCIQQANTNFRRPPLPDYHSAAQMAHLARQKQLWQMERAHSHEGLLGYYNEGEFEAAEDADEEQVSAV